MYLCFWVHHDRINRSIMDNEIIYNFAIVQFDNDSIEIIRLNWAEVNESEDVMHTYFPSTRSTKHFQDILTNDPIPDVTWTNNSKLWPVKKTFWFFGMYFF